MFHAIALVVLLSGDVTLGQPRPVDIPKLDRTMRINSISNLRVADQSKDGTELTLIMQYEYNGNNGSSALLVPIVDRNDDPEVARWFGADMIAVPPGTGPVSMKVRFFNDEAGAPEMMETDRVRVLILNHSGSSIIGGKNLIRKVQWGQADNASTGVPTEFDPRTEIIELASKAEERARLDADRAAEEEAIALQTLESSQNDLQKTEARSIAKEKAKEKAEAQARATEAALIKKEQKELLLASDGSSDLGQQQVLESRVTNVEVVNRSRDRSRVTLGIEFEIKDKFGFKPLIGARMLSSDLEETGPVFASAPAPVEKRKKFVLLPVTFAPSNEHDSLTMLTDRIEIFVTDESGEEHIPLETVTLPLTWRAPGFTEPSNVAGTIALQEFRQRNTHSGYATIKYYLPHGSGQLRVKVFDSSQPESASWFETSPVPVRSGRGLELVPVRIAGAGQYPGGDVSVDTVEVELLGDSGEVMGKVSRLTSINWSQKEQLRDN